MGHLTDFNAPALSIIQGYSYGDLGNRETKTVNGVTTVNVINANSNRLDSAGNKIYRHDTSGNLTSNGGQSFTYDVKGRLSGIIKSGTAYSYGINASQQLRWAWDNAGPFGNSAANPNPQGLGNFVYNLRFPG